MRTSPMGNLIAQYQMIPPNSTIFVAVSGGSDSIYLLHRLYHLQDELEFKLVALHYNHQLKKSGSFEAEAFVRDFIPKFCPGAPLLVEGAPIAQLALDKKLGVEEIGRQYRYDFFQKCAQSVENSRIATAHTAGDNGETALLNLARGAGLRGLAGIPPVRDNIIRPLLTTTREEILDYLTQHHLPHIEDPTNSDPDYTGRNALRHQVIPILRGLNPNFLENFAVTSQILRQEDEILNQLALDSLPPVTQSDTQISLSASGLASLAMPLALRGIQMLVQRLEKNLVLDFSHRDKIFALCQGENPSASLNLPQNFIARREYDKLVLTTASHAILPQQTLTLSCDVQISGYRITASRGIYEGVGTPSDFWISGDYQSLTLRSRQEGDQLKRPNRRQKSVKKLMIDEKIPRHLRDTLPVLANDGEVIAVARLGVSQFALPEAGTEGWHIMITEL